MYSLIEKVKTVKADRQWLDTSISIPGKLLLLSTPVPSYLSVTRFPLLSTVVIHSVESNSFLFISRVDCHGENFSVSIPASCGPLLYPGQRYHSQTWSQKGPKGLPAQTAPDPLQR